MEALPGTCVDSLRPARAREESCIRSLLSNRLRRMHLDKSSVSIHTRATSSLFIESVSLGWRPWLSYGTGKTFWHNEKTGETSWQRPKGAPEGTLVLKTLNSATATGMAKTSLDFESLERPDTVNPSSPGAPNTGESRSGTGINGRHVLPRSCYRRETFNRLREIAEISPANRPPQLGSITSRGEQKQPVEPLHAPGSKTHRENTQSSSRKELKNYYDSIVKREASKWQSIHHSIKVKTARNTDAYWIRLDEVHKGVHEGFKQMLLAGAHCMDLVYDVNGNNPYVLTTSDFVRLAAKLGVRTEEYEAESLFEIYGERGDCMDLETFGQVFINTDAIYQQMMAPALVSKMEGIEGTRKIVEMEKQDNERSHRRLAVRELCTELGLSIEKKMEAASKAEKKSHRQQMQEGKQINNEVQRSKKLADFMSKHAEKFGGAAADGKLLWRHLESLRALEEAGKDGLRNKSFVALVKGMMLEWHQLVVGQAKFAEIAYDDIDKATKRLDQRAIIQILSQKLKYLTTSWVRTQQAGLLALGAASRVGDPYATRVGIKMIGQVNEPVLREGACKLFGMILDPTDKETLDKILKKTSRREHPDVRAAAKKAVQDIMWRAQQFKAKKA